MKSLIGKSFGISSAVIGLSMMTVPAAEAFDAIRDIDFTINTGVPCPENGPILNDGNVWSICRNNILWASECPIAVYADGCDEDIDLGEVEELPEETFVEGDEVDDIPSPAAVLPGLLGMGLSAIRKRKSSSSEDV